MGAAAVATGAAMAVAGGEGKDFEEVNNNSAFLGGDMRTPKKPNKQ